VNGKKNPKSESTKSEGSAPKNRERDQPGSPRLFCGVSPPGRGQGRCVQVQRMWI